MNPFVAAQINAAERKPIPKLNAIAAPRRSRDLNKTETKYSELLNIMLIAGGILDWKFEPEGLRLADRTFYYPDFRVVTSERLIEFHDTKACRKSGEMLVTDDSLVKIKCAAEIHWMYLFKLAGLKASGEWTIREI